MKRIYIASPYTIGDQAENVKAQMDAAHRLMEAGFAPFWPLHSHFLHMVHPKPYAVWLDWDLTWLKCCDALLRLPGESAGADNEVGYAEDCNIPVFYSIEELINELR
jgi:hypothetical protein